MFRCFITDARLMMRRSNSSGARKGRRWVYTPCGANDPGGCTKLFAAHVSMLMKRLAHTYALRIETLGRWGSLSFPRRGALHGSKQTVTAIPLLSTGVAPAAEKKKEKAWAVLRSTCHDFRLRAKRLLRYRTGSRPLAAARFFFFFFFFCGLKVAGYVCSLQQPDGSFFGDEWGEVDTRFSYCALSSMAILGQLDNGKIDVKKAGEFVGRQVDKALEGSKTAVLGVSLDAVPFGTSEGLS